MKTILNFLILISPLVLAEELTQQLQQPQQIQQVQQNSQNQIQQPNDRKLLFSPYVSVTQDFSARTPGSETQKPQTSNNPLLGPFQNAPVPSYGLGGMTPPSLGMTNQPLNYMYGQPMVHPLHPMNQANAMNMAGMTTMNNMNMGQPHLNQMHHDPYMMAHDDMRMDDDHMLFGFPDDDLNDFNEFNDSLDFSPHHGASKLHDFLDSDEHDDELATKCASVQKQAIEISNAVMRRQNKAIYKTLMNYLLKSKYLLTMTEIKLTRVLRKKIYALMNQYSSITEDNIEFIPMKREYDLKPKVTAEGIEDAYNDFKEKEIRVGEQDFDQYAPGFEGVLSRK